MSEVALVATSGGLISEALVQDLRLEKVAGDGRFLTEVAGFRSLDGTPPTRTQHDTDLEAAFRTGQALWSPMLTSSTLAWMSAGSTSDCCSRFLSCWASSRSSNGPTWWPAAIRGRSRTSAGMRPRPFPSC